MLYFNIPVDALGTLLPPTGPMGRDQFLAAWKSVDDSQEVSKEVGAAAAQCRPRRRALWMVGGGCDLRYFRSYGNRSCTGVLFLECDLWTRAPAMVVVVVVVVLVVLVVIVMVVVVVVVVGDVDVVVVVVGVQVLLLLALLVPFIAMKLADGNTFPPGVSLRVRAYPCVGRSGVRVRVVDTLIRTLTRPFPHAYFLQPLLFFLFFLPPGVRLALRRGCSSSHPKASGAQHLLCRGQGGAGPAGEFRFGRFWPLDGVEYVVEALDLGRKSYYGGHS